MCHLAYRALKASIVKALESEEYFVVLWQPVVTRRVRFRERIYTKVYTNDVVVGISKKEAIMFNSSSYS